MNCQPSATLATLQQRAQLLVKIRSFFAARQVLEVETPLLSASTATDPHLTSLTTEYQGAGFSEKKLLYLQTSPELAMKRLLAAGSGSIYQICKAFRSGELGQRHNPEFTLLEWYRVGFNHFQLMDEIDALLHDLAALPKAVRISYRELFLQHTDLDPFTAKINAIKKLAASINTVGLDTNSDRDTWLNLILTHLIEPKLPSQPVFIYHYPASQAALAKIILDDVGQAVAARFELYINRLEIANGYYELCQPQEQRQRCSTDNHKRQLMRLPTIPINEFFIQALEQGLPECAGVALGIDRLLMALLNITAIKEVLAFDLTRS